MALLVMVGVSLSSVTNVNSPSQNVLDRAASVLEGDDAPGKRGSAA